jgi:acyl carrier protein
MSDASQTVKETMAAFLKLPVAQLEDTRILTDLVSDSFLLVQMVIELQEEFGVRLVQEDLKTVKTVQDLTQLLTSRMTPQKPS